MKHLLSSITLLLLSNLAFGQVPNTFSSGETISSSKINANFSFLADAMAGGNVTAMMLCESHGQNLTNSKFVFGKCQTSDNSSDAFTVGNWVDARYGYTNNNDKQVSLEEIVNQNWLLVSSSEGFDSQKLFFFYKVSSD